MNYENINNYYKRKKKNCDTQFFVLFDIFQ